MSDDRRREAERRYRETGDVADQARVLMERVRVGELDRDRVRLAAYCGLPAAQLAEPATTSPENLIDFVRGLPAFGPNVHFQAALVAAHKLRSFERVREPLERFVKCPCETHRREFERSLPRMTRGTWDVSRPGFAINIVRRAAGNLPPGQAELLERIKVHIREWALSDDWNRGR